MNKKQAIELLDSVKFGNKRSRVNPNMTTKEAIDIVKVGISSMEDDQILGDIIEKRVWQVVKNQKRPRY